MTANSIASRAAGLVTDRRFLLAIGLAGLFIMLTLYVWKTHIANKINPAYVPNREFLAEDQEIPDEVDLYFFYTVWCPHCTKAKPEWVKFKETIGETKINGVKVNFIEIDCDKDTETADRFHVDSYPTIKLVLTDDNIIEYDAKPDVDTLHKFLNVSI